MNNDNDDPSLISLSDSFEDDSLLLDTDNPIFARPPPVNPSARNPFAKPVIKTAQAYLDLKNSDIYDVDDDDDDDEEEVEKGVEVVQKKDIKNMKNNTKAKNSRDPTIELIEIDDDDDDDDYLNHTGLSQSMMSLRTRTPIKNASTPRRTSPRKASTFNRDLVDPIDLDPIDHMIQDSSPIRPRASSIVSSPKKKPRTTPPDEMIVVDLTMEDDEELKKKGQRSRSRSRSAAIRKAFHFDDSLDFLTSNRDVDLATMNDDGDDGDKSIRPTVPITRNIRRKESSIRRKAQTSTNEIHIDLTLDSPMVDDDEDEDVIEIVDDEKVSTVRVATTSTVTTSETISRNDSSNLIEESTISTTSMNTSSTRFSDIKARFDALVKRSSGASSTSTISAPKEDELDLRPPGQSTQERELIHELEDMSSFSTSDFTILKERRSEDQPGPSRDDWFELDDDDDDDLGPPIGMGIVPSQRLPKSHSTPFPPITSTTSTIPAPKATKPRAKKANRQLLSGKKVTKLKGTTSKTTTKTTSKNQRRVNQNLFTEDLDEDLGDDDDEQGQQESTDPKQPVMKQSDAIRHITVHVPAAVLELAPTELPRLKIEKELDYLVVEDGSDGDEDEMELCVRWKARPILEQMLKEVDGSVKVQRSSGLLDHLLVVVQAGLLHDCVGLFVESLKDKDSINSNDIPEDECDLYGIVHKCCTKYGIHNVTVVLHGVESYLKSQRSQANRSFRRRLKNLMAAEQNGVDAAQVDGNNKKNRTRKKKDQPEKESRIELTLDNIEMCLIDARMRFYYAHDEAHAHFGTVNVDSEEDLAKVIYQYTRSLSEQIFRLTKTRSSCIDFYAVHDKMVSIDPNTAQNRKDLWLRQLQQFPSISAMSAELIAHCFTSPKVMFDALRQSEDPVKMLAETGIGRKKIGLELACKIVQFMTTVEPDLVLKSLTGCTT